MDLLAETTIKPGLLIVTDTGLTEESYNVLDRFANGRGSDVFVKVWNRRELENRLLRRPNLISKYGLELEGNGNVRQLFNDGALSDKKILIVSDSSIR